MKELRSAELVKWLVGALFTYGVYITWAGDMNGSESLALLLVSLLMWPLMLGGVVGDVLLNEGLI